MPSTRNRNAIQAILAVFSVVALVYSVIIIQQILAGLILAVVPWLLYLFVRFVFILERIATALERIATARTQKQESYERGTETEGGVENE